MQQGTIEQAVELAKQRWAQIWPFDIDAATWLQLASEHRPTDLLEAIKHTKTTRAKEPDAVYQSLLYWLNRLEAERYERNNPLWPPADTQQQN